MSLPRAFAAQGKADRQRRPVPFNSRRPRRPRRKFSVTYFLSWQLGASSLEPLAGTVSDNPMSGGQGTARNGSTAVQRGLWRLMLKLPSIRGCLQLIAARSVHLNEMFEAYQEAYVALQRFQKECGRSTSGLIEEYEALCTERTTASISCWTTRAHALENTPRAIFGFIQICGCNRLLIKISVWISAWATAAGQP